MREQVEKGKMQFRPFEHTNDVRNIAFCLKLLINYVSHSEVNWLTVLTRNEAKSNGAVVIVRTRIIIDLNLLAKDKQNWIDQTKHIENTLHLSLTYITAAKIIGNPLNGGCCRPLIQLSRHPHTLHELLFRTAKKMPKSRVLFISISAYVSCIRPHCCTSWTATSIFGFTDKAVRLHIGGEATNHSRHWWYELRISEKVHSAVCYAVK